MFDLKFKENLKEALVEEVVDLISDEPEEFLHQDPETHVNTRPLHTDKYEELLKVINTKAKDHIIVQKQQAKSLFGASSVIAIFLTLITSVLVQVDVALSDGEFSSREGIQVAITLIGAITSIAARGSEGKEGVYTPKGIPGLNKEDYDGDGIPDHLDETPWGI